MSKIKLLLDVIADLRNLADSLREMALALEDNAPAPDTQGMEETSSEGLLSEAEATRPVDTIPLEKVRAALAVKSQDGFGAEIRDLLRKYGADKLSAVDPAHFPALLADAEAIGNE